MRTLADFIFDLAQNSINADARNIHIYLEESTRANELKIVIKDDGRGIRKEDLPKVKQPFFTTRPESKRRVGLGLALMEQACTEAEGGLTVESELGTGTTVTVSMKLDHIDRAPLGDLAGIFTSLLVDLPRKNLEWTIEHKRGLRRYRITSQELLDELNLSSFGGIEARGKVAEYIEGKEKLIR